MSLGVCNVYIKAIMSVQLTTARATFRFKINGNGLNSPIQASELGYQDFSAANNFYHGEVVELIFLN